MPPADPNPCCRRSSSSLPPPSAKGMGLAPDSGLLQASGAHCAITTVEARETDQTRSSMETDTRAMLEDVLGPTRSTWEAVCFPRQCQVRKDLQEAFRELSPGAGACGSKWPFLSGQEREVYSRPREHQDQGPRGTQQPTWGTC